MLSPETTGRLTAFLRSLPEPVALRLAKAVEVDRVAGGTTLPHDVILAALRASLSQQIPDTLAGSTDIGREGNLENDITAGRIERAPREIRAALPVHDTGLFAGGPVAPDLDHPADAEATERGLRCARLLVASRKSAAASFGAAHKDAFDEASNHLKGYSDGIVREVRAAEGARRTIAEQYFAIASELTAILCGDEEAELFRRRGRAAMADAA